MAFQWSEIWRSGEGTIGQNGDGELNVMVWGDPVADNADDAFTVTKFALALLPIVDEFGYVFSDFSRERQAEGNWLFHGRYKSIESNRQTNDASFSFSTGGGNQHITHSLKTTAYDPDGTGAGHGPPGWTSFAEKTQGAINISGSGASRTVGGVDIRVSAFSFKTTFYIAPQNMTEDYIESLKTGTATVNSDEVTINVDGVQMTFQSGELLLVGADGSKRRGFGDWELGLAWESKKNVSGLVIGSGIWTISDIKKNGWDYLWVFSQAAVTEDSASIMPSPQNVFVEQVYPYTPLSGLLPATAFGLSNTQPWMQLTNTGAGFNS